MHSGLGPRNGCDDLTWEGIERGFCETINIVHLMSLLSTPPAF